jgi:drug/metabolite transporter (DMT)-like permease
MSACQGTGLQDKLFPVYNCRIIRLIQTCSYPHLFQRSSFSMPNQLIGILLSITAAISWGSGDFSGGAGTRRLSPYQVLFLASFSSLILLGALAIFHGEKIPSIDDLLVATLAGFVGALGLAALYHGLTLGNTAMVAPVAGVIGAILPLMVGILHQGLPRLSQLLGFIIALGGIWLVTRKHNVRTWKNNGSLKSAILAGIGFGGFLALIPQIKAPEIYMPLVFAKLSSLILAALVLWRTRQAVPRLAGAGLPLVAGAFDAGGNILYLFASHFARLDIVAVLSSLYPAWTVLLSYSIHKEHVTPTQWFGVWVCIAAIILISV